MRCRRSQALSRWSRWGLSSIALSYAQQEYLIKLRQKPIYKRLVYELVFWGDIEMKRKERFEGEEVLTPEGSKKVYPVGAWAWLEEGDE